MNKKFSTLVAAVMLATSFGASAQTTVADATTLKSGADYYLGDATTNVLMVSSDSLIMKPKTDIATMNKIVRNHAVWTVSYTTSATGAATYELTNKATKLKLQLPASGKAFAFVTTGINQFGWLEGGTYTTKGGAVALSNKANGKELVLQNAFVLGKEVKTNGSDAKFVEANGYSHIEVVNKAAFDLTNSALFKAITALKGVTFNGTTILADRKTADVAITKIGVELAKIGIETTKVPTYVALKAVNLDLTHSATIDLSTSSTAKTDFETAIEKLVTKYGVTTIDADGKMGGIVVATDITTTTFIPAGTYKKGTIFVKTDSELKFVPALMDAMAVTNTPDATLYTSKEDADERYNIAFVKEFKKGTEAIKDVTTTLGFDVPAGSTVEKNVLAGHTIQLVGRNLLVGTDAKPKAGSETLITTDFAKANLIMNEKGEYLAMTSATYEPGKASSTYFKLAWKALKAYPKGQVSGAGDDAKFYRGVDGCLTSNYLFDFSYDMNTDAVVISPKWLAVKTEATTDKDSIGSTYTMTKNADGTNHYQLSLKQFSNSVEMTVVNADASANEKIYRIHTGATAPVVGWEITSKPSDVYFIQYISALAANKEKNEKFYTSEGLQKGSVEVFNELPYAQWALVKNDNGLVTIVNRENETKVLKDESSHLFQNVQLYKAGGELVSVYEGDTLKLTSVASNFKKDSTLGYFAHDAKLNTVKKYKLTYFNELDATKNVSYTKDSVMFVDKKGEGMWFQVVPVKDETKEFGADAIKDVSKKLKRSQYTMFTKMNGKQYNVVFNKLNKMFEISAATSDEAPATFYIKEMMHADKHWSVLENVAAEGWDKVSVNDNTLELFGELNTEKRTSMFALTGEDAPIYRRLGATIADGIAKNDTAYVEFFKADEPSRFLFENTVNKVANNSTGIAKDSLNFLGMYNKADFKVNASIFVDTAYVRNDTIKPLYMLAVDTKYVPSEAVKCPICGLINCPHHKDVTKAYTAGRYLVALHDSVAVNASAKYQGNTRLAFVPAKHVADTLVINNSIYTGVKGQFIKDSLIVLGENMTNATFAFRLVNETPADFYIESAPVDAAPQYVRIHNGIPVLVSELADAAIFNVTKTTVRPTDNEENAINTVSVFATDGAVIINNAAGKTVMISNMLGQTIANTVITSDNATIAVPAGIAVVAVEGEKAVKAVVR